MTVIALSIPGFSGERNLARRLAERLGFRCVDPEVVLERAAAWGPTNDELLDALLSPPAAKDRRRLGLLQAALAEELQGADAVCYGNLAKIVPDDAAEVIRVNVRVPFRLRRRFVQDSLHLSRAAAVLFLRRLDRDAARWRRRARGAGVAAAGPYDARVRLEELDPSEAALTVAAAIRARPPRLHSRLARAWALAGVLVSAAVVLRVATPPTRTIAGVITDTLCGARHAFSGAANEVECVQECVREADGAGYALYDGRHLYRLTDSPGAGQYAAQKVLVTGTLDRASNTIHVGSITPRS